MPLVKPVSFQITAPLARRGINLGASTELQQKVDEHNVPQQLYEIYAPIIGFNKLILGKQASREEYVPKLTQVLQTLLSDQFSKEKSSIKQTIETVFDVAKTVIYQFYFNLSKMHQPWPKKREKILAQYKDVFLQLEAFGASWLHIRGQNKEIFADLVRFVFDSDSLTVGLGDVELGGGDYGYGKFEEAVNLYLPLGANINARMTANPDFGTFLHYYLAFETPFSDRLIQFIESKRTKNLNTHFNYELRDGFGNTPLLIAILTGQESAAFALLALGKKGLAVGINRADSQGRSPLLLAAALGMPKVVAELLKQGANPLAKDKNGLGLDDYAHLNPKDIAEIVSPLVHPDRGSKVNHSYLYYDDIWSSPICFYEKDETEKTGKEQIPHLVVLSPLSPHKEKLARLVAHLQEEAKKGNKAAEKLVPHILDQINKVLDTPTFLQVCMGGQSKVQDYLGHKEAVTTIIKWKEQLLRCACALGKLEVIKQLLDEGINPNATDDMDRSSLHYTAMRFELVYKELILEAAEKGEAPSEDIEQQAKAAQEKHPMVLELLFKYSKQALDFKVLNKANNSPEFILNRDAKNGIQHDAVIAKSCLDVIAKNSKMDLPKSEEELQKPKEETPTVFKVI
jgi:ankyrin repeat protein